MENPWLWISIASFASFVFGALIGYSVGESEADKMHNFGKGVGEALNSEKPLKIEPITWGDVFQGVSTFASLAAEISRNPKTKPMPPKERDVTESEVKLLPEGKGECKRR